MATRIRRRRGDKGSHGDELPRLWLHALWGTAFALAYLAGLDTRLAIGAMSVAFAVLGALEVIRLAYRRRPIEDPMGFFARTYARIGRRFMRTPERRGQVVAALASVVGYLAALALFPRQIAVAAMLSAALADPAARLIGRRLGTIRFVGHKTLEGTAAMALATFVVARVVGFDWVASVAAAVAAITADLASGVRWPWGSLDDNLTMPIFVGAALAAIVLATERANLGV